MLSLQLSGSGPDVGSPRHLGRRRCPAPYVPDLFSFFLFFSFQIFISACYAPTHPPTPARQINKPLSNLLITHCKINSLLASCCCGLTAARSCSSDPLCCRAVYVHAGVAVSVAVCPWQCRVQASCSHRFNHTSYICDFLENCCSRLTGSVCKRTAANMSHRHCNNLTAASAGGRRNCRARLSASAVSLFYCSRV